MLLILANINTVYTVLIVTIINTVHKAINTDQYLVCFLGVAETVTD